MGGSVASGEEAAAAAPADGPPPRRSAERIRIAGAKRSAEAAQLPPPAAPARASPDAELMLVKREEGDSAAASHAPVVHAAVALPATASAASARPLPVVVAAQPPAAIRAPRRSVGPAGPGAPELSADPQALFDLAVSAEDAETMFSVVGSAYRDVEVADVVCSPSVRVVDAVGGGAPASYSSLAQLGRRFVVARRAIAAGEFISAYVGPVLRRQGDGLLELHAYAFDRTQGLADTVVGHPRAFTSYLKAGGRRGIYMARGAAGLSCRLPCLFLLLLVLAATPASATPNVEVFRAWYSPWGAAPAVPGSLGRLAWQGPMPARSCEWPAFRASHDIAAGEELLADFGVGYLAAVDARSAAEQRVAVGLRGELSCGHVVIGDYAAMASLINNSQVLALDWLFDGKVRLQSVRQSGPLSSHPIVGDMLRSQPACVSAAQLRKRWRPLLNRLTTEARELKRKKSADGAAPSSGAAAKPGGPDEPQQAAAASVGGPGDADLDGDPADSDSDSESGSASDRDAASASGPWWT